MTDADGTQLFHTSMPFSAKLGIEALEVTSERVRSTLAWAEDLCTIGGALHGGVLMSLADATGAVCAFLNLPEGAQGTTTVESKTNFLRAARSASVTATSTPLHAGRSFIVVETTIHDDAGKLVGKVTQTQAVL